MIIVSIKILCFALCIQEICCEFHSSTDKLRELFDIENEVLRELVDIVNQFKEIGDFLRYKINPWNYEHVAVEKDVEKYVTNPLNAFLLLKRNVYDVEMLQNKLTMFINDLTVKLQSLQERNVIEKREVSGAVAGVIRAQHGYHLKSENLIEGIIEEEKTRKPLTLHDIYVIANETYFLPEKAYFAKNYFEIVAEKLKSGEDIYNEIDEDEIFVKLEALNSEIIEEPFDETLAVGDVGITFMDRKITQKICRGNLTRPAKETKDLQCRFVSFSPFSSIAPFKLEELSIDPHIVIYHEMISEAEVNELLEIARPIQYKAGIYVDLSFVSEEYRMAQVAWLKDGHHQILNKLNARFEDMTGLTMETAEPLQVQNYGIGGHFYEHYDNNVERTDSSSRDRMATIMIYLSDVEKGGATVFPCLKLYVEPKKGSSMFWYNFKPSGFNDHSTLHSGCPVLLGSKWVANKWIHNIKQEFRRLCQPGEFELKDRKSEIVNCFNKNWIE